jgi:hypothetical protein
MLLVIRQKVVQTVDKSEFLSGCEEICDDADCSFW